MAVVRFKICDYFQNGKCRIIEMLTGYPANCIRKSNCVNLKIKRGYGIK